MKDIAREVYAYVTTWYDQSGNSNDATQTTASEQPQIVSSGSVINDNEKPALQFDGSNDILRINYFDYYGGGISKLFTSTVAKRNLSTVSTKIIFSHNNEGGSPSYRSFVSAYTSGVSPGRFAAHFSTNNSSNSINTFQQWSDLKQYNLITIYDTNNATQSNRVIVYANGLSTYNSNISAQAGNLSEATNIPLTIGGINSNLALWQGNIQEVIFYPSDQSSNRTGIETNINDFYSIYYVSPDADAQAFFDRVDTAGGSLTSTEEDAIGKLVFDLKAAGIWTKIKAIYPMVGASAAACAQNLKSSSFTGTFNGGWTFASTGATPNGTNGYMDTGLNNSIELWLNSNSIAYYLDTFLSEQIPFLIGDGSGSFLGTWEVSRFPNSVGIGAEVANNSGFPSSQYLNQPSGFYVTYRNNATQINLRGSSNLLTYSKNSVSLVNRTIKFGAFDNNGSFNNYQINETRFASIGDGLTDTEASDLYTAVQAFQTTLSRNVW